MTSTEQAGNRAFGVLTCPNAMKEDSGIKLSITSGYPQISIIQKKILGGSFSFRGDFFWERSGTLPYGTYESNIVKENHIGLVVGEIHKYRQPHR